MRTARGCLTFKVVFMNSSIRVYTLYISCMLIMGVALYAQTGSINGKVTTGGSAAAGVVVRIEKLRLQTVSNSSGVYTFNKVPAGTHTLSFSGVGYKRFSREVVVRANETAMPEDIVESDVKQMSEVMVYGASRREQKITDAPAAVSVVLPEDLQRGTSHGQLAKSLEHFQGVDVVQSGMNDFNVNTRGFNNSINRRVLVLVDGRDPSTPLINLVEWNSLQTNMSDVKKIEVVRGPGSALYGANAYNGVVSIITNAPKDVLGTRIGVTGGQFGTFRFDGRHAMELGDLSFKLNLGYSRQNQDWILSRQRDTTKPNNGLEYPGIASDVAGNRIGVGNITNIDSLINEHRTAFNYLGTLRADYQLNSSDKLIGEVGYSKYGNEYFVNQTGRILIPDVEKPFARLAYSSPRINAQAHYYRRNTPIPQIVMNAAATSGEKSDVVVVDAQWNDSFLDDKLRVIAGASHEYQHVVTAVSGSSPLLSPDDIHHNFSGFYGQAEYQILSNLQFVGAARVDRSTFHETQFSPKGGIVWTLAQDHTFRVTVNRSFLRPSYGDRFRRSPAGAPVNLAAIDSTVNAVTGVAKLGLGVTPSYNLGNPTVNVETAMSYEFGYKGIITKDLFVTLDAYMNKRSNFISNPLGGLAPDVYVPVRYGNVQADSVLRAQLGKINPLLYDRLAVDKESGKPAFIVAPTNIGLVTEMGLELGANYYITDKLLASGNFAYLDYKVDENKVPTSKILANTSPRRYNISLQYTDPNSIDIGASFRYVDGFQWIAGTVEGSVPAYGVLNINASYHLKEVAEGLRLGVNVFNALDREHYEIFGGTYLYRYITGTLSFQF